MKQTHNLKIDECYLKSKLAGDKLFEIRVDDRGYQKGDETVYRECPVAGKAIEHRYEITYVTNYAQHDGYVVFGEKHIDSCEAI